MKTLALLMSFAFLSNADDRFLAALDSHGIQYANPQWAISGAYLVCGELDAGAQPQAIATQIEQNSNLDDWHAGFFIGASIAAYCPEHLQ